MNCVFHIVTNHCTIYVYVCVSNWPALSPQMVMDQWLVKVNLDNYIVDYMYVGQCNLQHNQRPLVFRECT